MQADRGLVEYVEHVDQAGAQGGGEGDAAGLAAAERPQRAIESQVAQAHRFKIPQPRLHLFEHHAADLALPVGQIQPAEECGGITDLHRADFADILTADLGRQRLGPQPRAAATRARPIAPPAAEKHADVHLVLPPLQPREETFQPAEFPFRHAVDDHVEVLRRQIAERNVHGDAVVRRQGEQFLQLMGVGRAVPWRDRAAAERLAGVGNDQLHVDADDVAETFAFGAGTHRTVETVEPRLRRRILDAAILASELRAEPEPPPGLAVDLNEGRGKGGEGERSPLSARNTGRAPL